MLKGKKTYIVAAASIAYAALGVVLGHLDYNAAVQIVVDSGLIAALRNGVANG